MNGYKFMGDRSHGHRSLRRKCFRWRKRFQFWSQRKWWLTNLILQGDYRFKSGHFWKKVKYLSEHEKEKSVKTRLICRSVMSLFLGCFIFGILDSDTIYVCLFRFTKQRKYAMIPTRPLKFGGSVFFYHKLRRLAGADLTKCEFFAKPTKIEEFLIANCSV